MFNKSWLVIAGALLTVNVAWAGSQLEDSLNACTTVNCGSMLIRGVHQANEPFIMQIFAAQGDCLRLDVDTQTQDMAMIVLAPSINVFGGNDDRDGADLRPLFFENSIPWTGWYTVAVSYFDLDNRTAKFTLRYGRYNSGNINCSSPAATSQQFKRLNGDQSKVFGPAASPIEMAGQGQ